MPRKASSEKPAKIVKKLPATDYGPGVLCTKALGNRFQITQNPEKKKFTLWRILDGGFEKIAMANTPVDLYSKIAWDK